VQFEQQLIDVMTRLVEQRRQQSELVAFNVQLDDVNMRVTQPEHEHANRVMSYYCSD